MEVIKSQGEMYLYITELLLLDVCSSKETMHWFPKSAASLTFKKVKKRYEQEGLSFLTKTLPRFGKALEKALSGGHRLVVPGFRKVPGSSLPKFLGELTSRVFDESGWLKPNPCITSAVNLRAILLAFYKLETAYEKRQTEACVEAFKEADRSLSEPTNTATAIPSGFSIQADRASKSANSDFGAALPSGAKQRDRALRDSEEHDVRPLTHPERSSGCVYHTADLVNGSQRGTHSRCGSCHQQYPLSGIYWDLSKLHLGSTRGCRNIPTNRGILEAYDYRVIRTAHEIAVRTHGKDRVILEEALDSILRKEGWVKGSGETGYSAARRSSSSTLVGIPGLTFTLEPLVLLKQAKWLCHRLLGSFDPRDIRPRHGPGTVSTRECPWEKRLQSTYYPSLAEFYPYDQYFYWSRTHLCDEMRHFLRLEEQVPKARISFAPKDSRGPRIISCEPRDIMWIQQGIMAGLMQHIEAHPLTKGYVSFTEQAINQSLAKEGSMGGLATLDLKEASDRVSLNLVRALFPDLLVRGLEAARSTYTVLPSGEEFKLRKHAPMGSSNCFPVMAVCIWALTSACMMVKYSVPYRKIAGRVFVYGDDVIVPEQDATDTMAALEAVRLKVNRDKSYTSGHYKESCGENWFSGHCLNITMFRKPWSSRRSPITLPAWIEYSNSLYKRGFRLTAAGIARQVEALYGPIPRTSEDSSLTTTISFCHELGMTDYQRPLRRRYNPQLQRWEVKTWSIKPRKRVVNQIGWCDVLQSWSQGFTPSWPVVTVDRSGKLPAFQLKLQVGGSMRGSNQEIGDRGGQRPHATSDSDGNTVTYAIPRESKLSRDWHGE